MLDLTFLHHQFYHQSTASNNIDEAFGSQRKCATAIYNCIKLIILKAELLFKAFFSFTSASQTHLIEINMPILSCYSQVLI